MKRREFLDSLKGIFLITYYDNLIVPEIEKPIFSTYLTIDDGPSSNMETILDYLANSNDKVTFFMIGKNLQNEKNMRLTMKAIEQNHVVGNHSFSHPSFSKLSLSDAIMEIKQGNKYIDLAYNGVGLKNPNLFRFPYGDKGNKNNKKDIQHYLDENEYTCFDWNIDTLDWKYYSGKRSIENVLKSLNNVSQGDIILTHDFNKKEKICTSIEVLKYLNSKKINSKSLKPKTIPKTFLELPFNEEFSSKKNILTFVENP